MILTMVTKTVLLIVMENHKAASNWRTVIRSYTQVVNDFSSALTHATTGNGILLWRQLRVNLACQSHCFLFLFKNLNTHVSLSLQELNEQSWQTTAATYQNICSRKLWPICPVWTLAICHKQVVVLSPLLASRVRHWKPQHKRKHAENRRPYPLRLPDLQGIQWRFVITEDCAL
jgi:hypothetical protein